MAAAAIVLAACPTAVATPAHAAGPSPTRAPNHTMAAVRVDAAWVRAAPPGVAMLAGYMVLHNEGSTPLTFTGASSDAFGMVELHRSQTVNGMETMRPAGAQAIPAGGVLRIEPGGLHLMLMQPKRALKIGDAVHFTLHFAGGADADVSATVRADAPSPH
ncbi:MAG TPA: copper chaperone PCu(A)C [Xanthomonadaceae bacterium]